MRAALPLFIHFRRLYNHTLFYFSMSRSFCVIFHRLQIRARTRGDIGDVEDRDAMLKLLSDLTVPLPELLELMQVRDG